MNSNIENLNGILSALILKQRENYVLETLEALEQYLIEENITVQEVQEYMKSAQKIVFKK